MAKKSNSKKVTEINVDNNIVTNLPPIEVLSNVDTVCEKHEDLRILSSDFGITYKMKDLTITELQAYENLLRMLVLHYEKMLRLDDVEGRPVMSSNRNKYNSFSAIYAKLLVYIENKVLDLEKYEWD